MEDPLDHRRYIIKIPKNAIFIFARDFFHAGNKYNENEVFRVFCYFKYGCETIPCGLFNEQLYRGYFYREKDLKKQMEVRDVNCLTSSALINVIKLNNIYFPKKEFKF